MSPSRLLVGFFTAGVAVLLLGTPRLLAAQGADVIRGRIVDSDSVPVEGARVTATTLGTNVTRPTRTDRNGRFTIVFPGGEGHYIVSVSHVGYVVKTFELRRTADQDVLVADAMLQKVQLDAVVVEAEVRGTIPRGSITPDVGGTEISALNSALLASQMGDLLALLSTIPGVMTIPGVDGSADGFSVLGLDPSDNSITMNGMTFDGGDLPRDAGVNTSLATNPYDVSRGGFSGGQVNMRTSSGSNIRTRGFNFGFDPPELSWTDRASQARGTVPTNLSFGGLLSGPFKENSSYYRVSYQLDRRSNPVQTLLNTNPLGLQSNNIASDSVLRLLGTLNELGIPSAPGGSPRTAYNDRGSLLASFNLTPLSSATGSTYGITLNGSWNRNTPSGGDLTRSLPSFFTERESIQGSLQLRHTGYYKFFLSETSVGAGGSRSSTDPFADLPSGRVRVNSSFSDGTSGVSNLNFGGSQDRGNSSSSRNANFMNTLSWFSNNNKHRLKLGTELNYSGNSSEQANNYFGTFAFNSLADLEAGIPSSYSRQLSVRRSGTSQLTGAVSLGDTYRLNPDFQLQYGVRVDGGTYFDKPEYNPVVESTFGVRNDFVPSRLYVSPRIGFSWTLGSASQIAAFEGAVRGPRAIVRGGIAVQQNTLGSIGSIINSTGLPSAIQSLNCVGDAAPLPEWELYLNDPSLIPDECADGTAGTVFSNSSPNVTLYSRNFSTPRSIRSNLSWQDAVLDARFMLNVSATHSLNLNRQSQVDLNFDPTVRFTLENEGGRPVFVQPTSIFPATGAIASRDARVSQSFSRVNELRSDLRSETFQLQLRLSPYRSSPLTKFRWNVGYTWQDVREQQRGFSSTVGNPLDVYWSRGSSTARHQISYSLSYTVFRLGSIGWNGSFTSGRPYTPSIAGDVNGDGSPNDRPFIFDPANAADPEVAAAMQQLLSTTSRDARECLTRQLGRLAGRNSCEGRWTMSGTLRFDLDAARLRLPNRAQVQFAFDNPLTGVDLLFNGSRSPKGWGRPQQQVDNTLLYVRGFDPNTNTFKYEVNQRFGTARRERITLSPMRIRATVRMDVGPVRERQSLATSLSYGRERPGSRYPAALFKSLGTTSIPNPITTILRQQDSLRLSADQADSIATLNRRFTVRLDSIWGVAAEYFGSLPDAFDPDDAWHRYLSARRAAIDLMMVIGPAIEGLLEPSQKRKLPNNILTSLDPRYLSAVRNGTGTYVTGLGGPIAGGFVASETFVGTAGSMVIVR